MLIYNRYLASMLNEDIYEGKSIIDDRKLQALAGGLKAYTTWEAVDTLQTCRECTGGMVSRAGGSRVH